MSKTAVGGGGEAFNKGHLSMRELQKQPKKLFFDNKEHFTASKL